MIRSGDSASLSRAFTARDIAALAALTGGPVTADVPDALVAAMLSCLLGMHLPGPGTGWLKQTLHHHAAARRDERLTARVTVTRLRPDKRLADLDCSVHGDGGRAILSGRALMLLAPAPSGQQPQPPGPFQQHPHG